MLLCQCHYVKCELGLTEITCFSLDSLQFYQCDFLSSRLKTIARDNITRNLARRHTRLSAAVSKCTPCKSDILNVHSFLSCKVDKCSSICQEGNLTVFSHTLLYMVISNLMFPITGSDDDNRSCQNIMVIIIINFIY